MSEVQKAIASVVELETRLHGELIDAGQRRVDAGRTATPYERRSIAARHLLYVERVFRAGAAHCAGRVVA